MDSILVRGQAGVVQPLSWAEDAIGQDGMKGTITEVYSWRDVTLLSDANTCALEDALGYAESVLRSLQMLALGDGIPETEAIVVTNS